MRKVSLLVILVLAFGTLASTSMIRTAKADIDRWDWLGQVHEYDPYWDASDVTVFPEESTATLTVTVDNPPGADPLNVSAVIVWLDWNENFSSPECSEDSPWVIEALRSHTFTVIVDVPSTSTASNLVVHDYTIYVEEVNATTGPKEVSIHDTATDDDFIVYSTTQKDAQRLYDKLDALNDTVDPDDFESIEAVASWYNGTFQYDFGLSSHTSGDFSDAKTYYEDALELFYDALSTETDFQKDFEDLEILAAQAVVAQLQANASYLEALGDAAKIRAQAFNIQAIALVVFGLGFLMFGVAAVVWAYRRPIPPP